MVPTGNLVLRVPREESARLVLQDQWVLRDRLRTSRQSGEILERLVVLVLSDYLVLMVSQAHKGPRAAAEPPGLQECRVCPAHPVTLDLRGQRVSRGLWVR